MMSILVNRGPAALSERERDAMAAEVRNLLVVAEWAQGAPHHDGCVARFIGDTRRCTCGRDEALHPFTEEADRG
jgi:class 3 adenylate cyclase